MSTNINIELPNIKYYSQIDNNNDGKKEISITDENGTTNVYYENGYLREDEFSCIFASNLEKYVDEDTKNISKNVLNNFVKDVTIDTYSADNIYTYIGYDTDQLDPGGYMAGKNAYVETFNNLVEIYTDKESSEGGEDITPNEYAKMLEIFLINERTHKLSPEEIEKKNKKEQSKTKTDNNTNTTEKKGFWQKIKSFFGID